MRFTYHDLLNADGTRNEAAFSMILKACIAAETNGALCHAAKITVPRTLRYRDVRPWQAGIAAGLDPALISQSVRERIAKHQRERLESWVEAMQVAAAAQRSSMDAAFQRAAE